LELAPIPLRHFYEDVRRGWIGFVFFLDIDGVWTWEPEP
jgi:hypothetical protein